MKKLKLKKIVPYALVATLVLSGCGKKAECDYPNRHVHKYTKKITKDITLEGYFEDESLTRSGFKWNEEKKEINSKDSKFFQELESKAFGHDDLILGEDNWDYLYYKMANQHDYLEYYWRYTTTEYYYTTDSDGNRTRHKRNVTKSGWSEDPRHAHNTGDVIVKHHIYFAYSIVFDNGKWKAKRSPYVNDIRTVLKDYPYVAEVFWDETESNTYTFSTYELPYLDVNQITPFRGPDLTNTNIDLVTNESHDNNLKPQDSTFENSSSTYEPSETGNSSFESYTQDSNGFENSSFESGSYIKN